MDKINTRTNQLRSGFTIVELLIVIVVIAILAAITVVAFNGVQDRARNSTVQSDIRQVQKLVESYNAANGSYPSTGGMNVTYVDSNCQLTSTNRRADWVPNLSSLASALPQNPGLSTTGIGRNGGCYMYASDGISYVLSAWNAKSGGPATDGLYRRLGFRETSFSSSNAYLCNHVNIGGSASGSYVITSDYYKHSYTLTNINSCNETPPAGA